MIRLLIRSHPPQELLPRHYGLVVTDCYRHRLLVAPIPLNLAIRWLLELWLRLRNPVPPDQLDRLASRFLYAQAYREGFRSGNAARYPPGTALVFTRATKDTVVAAWGVHVDAEELAQRVLTAAIRSGPDRRNAHASGL